MDEFKDLENNGEDLPQEENPIPEEVVEAVEEEFVDDSTPLDDAEESVDAPTVENTAPTFVPTIELDETGNPIPTAIELDETGNPIIPEKQYDANRKEYEPEIQYDDSNNPVSVTWVPTGNEWADATLPTSKKKYTLPIAIVAAVLVVLVLIVTLLPNLIPFNMTTYKFKSTNMYVRVQEKVLDGAEKQVYSLNGTTYVSVKGISDVFGYGAKKSGFAEKVKVNGKTYSIAHNAKRVNGKSLKYRVYAINKELFIAYEDAPKAFPNLKTCFLGDNDTPCIYDPVPTVKAGKTIQDLIDMYDGQVDAETIKQQLHITDDKELQMDYYEYQASIPMSKYAEMSDSTVADVFKNIQEQTGLDTSKFNEKSTYSEVQGAIPVAKMLGAEDEDSLNQALEQYGLTKDKIGFQITTKTKFSEVRNILYLQQIESTYEQDLQTKAQQDTSEPQAQLSDDDANADTAPEATEAPAAQSK